MPDMDGLAVLKALNQQNSELPIILMTAFATVHTAVAAVKHGAFDYVAKPFSNEQLELVLRRALEHQRLVEENRRLQARVREKEVFTAIVGASAPMRRVLTVIEKVAASDANVLILGESGTGKELVARAIHQASARGSRPFVPVDCASLPENLLESELFGHEKGAFTGATQPKLGLMEHVSGGTLFLDEVTELAPGLQSKLLRALQERTIRRVGGTEFREVDIRVVSASNRDVDARVRENKFRDDLLYRLKVIAVELPPLREREGDIPLLARHSFDELKSQTSKQLEGISAAAMMILESYSWPGNVRELHNVIERAIALTESTHITPLDLPPSLLASVERSEESGAGLGDFQREKQALIARFERDYIERMLRETEGNVAEAARRSGMERAAFHRLMRRCGIDAGLYRRT
jgi:DNA-binding NtrC family response regulator